MLNSETKEIKEKEREMDNLWIAHKVTQMEYRLLVDKDYIGESLKNDFKELAEYIKSNLMNIA